jgi:cytochrome b561
MSFIYASLGFVEITILFAGFIALLCIIVRAVIRSIVSRKPPPPKKQDLHHLKRAGQSGFY